MNPNDDIKQFRYMRREPRVMQAAEWKRARKRIYWREALVMAAIVLAIIWGLSGD